METTQFITQVDQSVPDYLCVNQKNINIIIFPDWSQPEESVNLYLERVIKAIATHPDSNQMTLVVYSCGISDEEANLVLSGVLMNILLQEDLDVTAGCEISLLSNLNAIEWESVTSKLHAGIIIEHENQETLAPFQAENIPVYEVKNFCHTQFEQLVIDLSDRLFHQRKWSAAIAEYKKFIEIYPPSIEIYWRLSECYRQLNLKDEYFRTLREAIQIYPTDARLHFSLIIDLRRNGYIQEAISSAENACKLLPNDYTFQLLKHLTVPTIYHNQEEISFYRERFTEGLQNLINQTTLKTAEEKNNALAGISRRIPSILRGRQLFWLPRPTKGIKRRFLANNSRA